MPALRLHRRSLVIRSEVRDGLRVRDAPTLFRFERLLRKLWLAGVLAGCTDILHLHSFIPRGTRFNFLRRGLIPNQY